MDIDALKKQAAEAAVKQIEPGMVVGLGTGSTSVHAVRAIGRLLEEGALQNIVGIPTSEATAAEARRWDIPLGSLDDYPIIDVTIDGADEIDPQLNLIKGLGGALLREKVVAAASRQMIVVADGRKVVDQLGTSVPLPVEVIRFALRPVVDYLTWLGAEVTVRHLGEEPFITDEENVILDCHFKGIEDPFGLAVQIQGQPGVVEHGLFLDMATAAVVATAEGLLVKDR